MAMPAPYATAYSNARGFSMRFEAFKISIPTMLPSLFIVEDDPGFILITLLNRSTTQLNGEHIHFLVVFYLHGFLQYLAILLVR